MYSIRPWTEVTSFNSLIQLNANICVCCGLQGCKCQSPGYAIKIWHLQLIMPSAKFTVSQSVSQWNERRFEMRHSIDQVKMSDFIVVCVVSVQYLIKLNQAIFSPRSFVCMCLHVVFRGWQRAGSGKLSSIHDL